MIELLVVIAIMGVLATIVLSSLPTARSRARDAKRLTDMKAIYTALVQYELDHGFVPRTTSYGVAINNFDKSTSSNFMSFLVDDGYLSGSIVDQLI